MRRDPRLWVFLAATVLAAWLLVPRVVGRWSPGRAVAADIDYICRETQEVFRLPASSPPPPHPQTGRATLVPAVYDPAKQAWRPGPPPELRQRRRATATR